jgi:hypothetical protein
LTIDAGKSLELGDLAVRAIPAAHEEIQTDAEDHHHFLGYLWQFHGLTVYHSGDCVPYEGLSTAVGGAGLALLPVNGRGNGVPGNFTFAEAARLCRDAHIPHFIPANSPQPPIFLRDDRLDGAPQRKPNGVMSDPPHHFGLFAFNTVDRAELEKEAATEPGIHLPDVSSWISLNTSPCK